MVAVSLSVCVGNGNICMAYGNGFTIKMSVLIPYRDVLVRWDRNDNDM